MALANVNWETFVLYIFDNKMLLQYICTVVVKCSRYQLFANCLNW